MGNICTTAAQDPPQSAGSPNTSKPKSPKAQEPSKVASSHSHEDRIVRQTRAKARMNVFTKPLSQMDVKNYIPPSFPKTDEQVKFLTEALLSNNFIFSSLPTSHSRLLIDAMEMCNFNSGDEIITQGDTDHAAFYAQCIMIGLAHMHDRKICYRDLKPENVMIDKYGYPIIVDLGFAKIVPERTYTLCGTPEYLAPEIILSKGHNKGVDIWAFGVLVFEMIYGFSPFYSEGVDQVTLFKRIVQVRYSFPSRRGTEESTDLISKLVVKRPTNRLGCAANGTGDDILAHPFFIHDNEVLYNRELTPPWVPEIKSNLDTGNFDSYTMEERDEERQKGRKKKSKLTREQQAMFEEF